MKTRFLIITILITVLSSCNTKTSDKVPVLKEIQPFTYCALEFQGSWSQYADAKKQITEEMEKQNIAINGEVVSVWYSYPDKTKEENYKWDVGYKVSNTTIVNKPLVLKEWNTEEVYSQVYNGSSEGSTDFFKSYWSWFESNNLKAIRPLLEIEAPKKDIGKNESKFEALIQAIKTN